MHAYFFLIQLFFVLWTWVALNLSNKQKQFSWHWAPLISDQTATLSPYHRWPKACTDWAGPGPHPTLVLSMARELIWHRAGKMCVEHWRRATSSFLPYKRQWYLLSCTEPSFPGIGFQKDRQRPPASSRGASGDRDSCSGQCWVATLSSIKDNRDHLGSEKQVWLSDGEQPWRQTLIQWIREGKALRDKRETKTDVFLHTSRITGVLVTDISKDWKRMHYQIEGGSPQFLSLNKYIQNFWEKAGKKMVWAIQSPQEQLLRPWGTPLSECRTWTSQSLTHNPLFPG